MNRHMLQVLAEGVEVPAGLTVERFEAEEFERVRSSLWMALAAEVIPRRLGKEADNGALATDKRIARKISNLYRSLWAAYERAGVDPAPAWRGREERRRLARMADPEARRAGATVRWGPWLAERTVDLAFRRKGAAAVGLREGRLLWSVRQVGMITTELDNIERIAGEL